MTELEEIDFDEDLWIQQETARLKSNFFQEPERKFKGCCIGVGSAVETMLGTSNSKLYKSTAGGPSMMERLGLLTNSAAKREETDFHVAVGELLLNDCDCCCLAAIADSRASGYFGRFRTMWGTAGTSHTEQNKAIATFMRENPSTCCEGAAKVFGCSARRISKIATAQKAAVDLGLPLNEHGMVEHRTYVAAPNKTNPFLVRNVGEGDAVGWIQPMPMPPPTTKLPYYPYLAPISVRTTLPTTTRHHLARPP